MDEPEQKDRLFYAFTLPRWMAGMGLSISRSITEAHGGRLWAESMVNSATFQFTLPTDEATRSG
jgi:two-component system sensor kinase FixL